MNDASEPPDSSLPAPGLDRLSRRAFFRLAGAGAAAAGLAACSSRPARNILPYASQPPEVTPGVPLHYATALVEDGFATGVLVASHQGRPTKIEGNPDHPASLGATRARDQAAVLSLYDPQRARSITDRGAPAAWSAIEQLLAGARAHGGRGLHLVLEPTSSPLVIDLIERIRTALPAARLAFWAPFAPRAQLAGNRLALGRALQTQLDLRTADVVVALDADLVGDHPMALAYARQIADRRRVVDTSSPMSRLYMVESGYSPTGVIADHRLRVRPSEVERIARALLAAVIAQGGRGAPAELGAALARPAGEPREAALIAAMARDLTRAAGRCAVAAGDRQPPRVHAIAAAINAALGNLGRTVAFSEPAVFEAGQPSHDVAALADLVRAIDGGEVTALLVLGGNPAYAAPADLGLAAAIARAPASLYLGLYDNETARACRFVVPGLHDLEQWGAARGYDGTITPIQPLIEPLFGGRSVAAILHELLGDPPATDHARTQDAWARRLPGVDHAAALARGTVAGSALPAVAAEVAWSALAAAIAAPPAAAPALELAIAPHPFLHDGRHTNNPWLLELPEPATKLTWDNAAQLSPRTAAQLGVDTGDLLALTVGAAAAARTLDVPAVVVPGHADDAITLHAGFGRDGGERVARGIGADAFRLWTTAGGLSPAVTAARRAGHRELAITQVHWQLEDRPIALGGTLQQLRDDAALRDELARHRGPQPTLLDRFPAGFPTQHNQWAMSIDLTTCTGCSACVMACATENNTPVVGRGSVLNKREMHWLRIDRYLEGPSDDPVVVVQPMTCQHCENAPCEYVCPVEATTHSPDGLNEMTYNRCIGTRFCSNNCPYKVRRFNWFDYKHRDLHVLANNPDVTVRDRGVMEKCTYCVQRIRRAEIDARIADRPIGAHDVVTACQAACPAQAIAFGSITDPASSVSEQRRRPHSYAVLHDQGTAPRTRYLARIRNPGQLP
ncbi:MAG TPA: 4Fe-4S dicluster domain-containing protein [Kofleriaceae bacterium]|nr:4Fe-4S dicluster domain-containing protein [Kofleriaceae bacterium]